MFAAIRLPMIPRPRSPIRSAGEAICSARGAIYSTGGALCLLMPESSSTRGFDAQTGALLELARELGWELFTQLLGGEGGRAAPLGAPAGGTSGRARCYQQVPAWRAWLSSRRSRRTVTTTLRYQRQLHLAQRFELAN